MSFFIKNYLKYSINFADDCKISESESALTMVCVLEGRSYEWIIMVYKRIDGETT